MLTNQKNMPCLCIGKLNISDDSISQLHRWYMWNNAKIMDFRIRYIRIWIHLHSCLTNRIQAFCYSLQLNFFICTITIIIWNALHIAMFFIPKTYSLQEFSVTLWEKWFTFDSLSFHGHPPAALIPWQQVCMDPSTTERGEHS